jgi:hypothetical protein
MHLARHCLEYFAVLALSPGLQHQAPDGSPQHQLLQAAVGMALHAARAGGGMLVTAAAVRAVHLLVGSCPAAMPADARAEVLLPWTMTLIEDAGQSLAAAGQNGGGEGSPCAHSSSSSSSLHTAPALLAQQSARGTAQALQLHAVGLAGQLLTLTPDGGHALLAARSGRGFVLASRLRTVQAALRAVVAQTAAPDASCCPGAADASASSSGRWPLGCLASGCVVTQREAGAALRGVVLCLQAAGPAGVNAVDLQGMTAFHVVVAHGGCSFPAALGEPPLPGNAYHAPPSLPPLPLPPLPAVRKGG